MSDTTTPSSTPTPNDVAPATPAPPPAAPAGPTRLPDDHPLVTAYATVKGEVGTLKGRVEEITRERDAIAAERDTATTQMENVPARVAGELKGYVQQIHGISDDDAALYLTSDDPATLLRQAAGLARRTTTGVVPTQGTGGQGAQVSGYDLGRERAEAHLSKNKTSS